MQGHWTPKDREVGFQHVHSEVSAEHSGGKSNNQTYEASHRRSLGWNSFSTRYYFLHLKKRDSLSKGIGEYCIRCQTVPSSWAECRMALL